MKVTCCVQETLAGAGRQVDVAYYLVHSMAGGAKGDFEERERRAASTFATMASREGVGRVVYLGGLGSQPSSRHLRSRHETAQLLERLGPPLTYFRAAMLVGAGSESYRIMRDLVSRLPLMLAPAWLSTPTQPIAADDAVAYLAQAARIDASRGRTVEIGGADVVSYGEMLDEMARALGRRPRPRLGVPWLSPKLSALWIGLVTGVDSGLARPLVESLSSQTTVERRSGMELFPVAPIGLRAMLERALAEDEEPRDDRIRPLRAP